MANREGSVTLGSAPPVAPPGAPHSAAPAPVTGAATISNTTEPSRSSTIEALQALIGMGGQNTSRPVDSLQSLLGNASASSPVPSTATTSDPSSGLFSHGFFARGGPSCVVESSGVLPVHPSLPAAAAVAAVVVMENQSRGGENEIDSTTLSPLHGIFCVLSLVASRARALRRVSSKLKRL